jgi:hypothetical protein
MVPTVFQIGQSVSVPADEPGLPDELVDRLLRLPAEETETPIEWTDVSTGLARITKIAAFSWSFFLEIQLDIPVGRLSRDIEWLTDSLTNGHDPMTDAIELRVEGQHGYDVTSGLLATEVRGALLTRASGEPVRKQCAVVGHKAKARYWFWPLPPKGLVSVSVAWTIADLNEVVGRFST